MSLQLLTSQLWRAWIDSRAYRLLPILAIFLAALLRFHNLDTQSLWNDEGNTLRLVERAVPELIAASNRDIHPPGYYLVLKVWYALTGNSEFALRFFSALCGVLTVAGVFAAGKALFSEGAGMVAAFLTALNTFSIFYGQEVRMYALMALMSALSMACFARWLRYRRLNWLIALALLNALGLYTQYAYPFVMLSQGVMFVLWWVWSLLRRSAFRKQLIAYVTANLLTMALFLPQLPAATAQLTGWARTGQDVLLDQALGTIVEWLIYGSTLHTLEQPLQPEIFIFPLILLVTGALLPDWIKRRADVPFWWWRLLPLVWLTLSLGLFLALGMFREANLKFLLPSQLAMALLLGRGIWLLWEIGTPSPFVPLEAAPRLIALFAALSVFNLTTEGITQLYNDPRFFRDDYRAIARLISDEARAGDSIVLNGPNQAEVFSYYYRGDLPVYGIPEGLGGDDSATQRQIEQVTSKHRRIYALYWGDSERDPRRVMERTLAQRTFEVASEWFGDVRLVRYAAIGTLGEPIAVSAKFGDHVTLQSAALSAQTLPLGDVLGIELTWQTDVPLDVRYRVSVQLLDSSGRLVLQRDTEPANDLALTTTWPVNTPVQDLHGLAIPPNLSEDSYTLIVVMYRFESGAAPDRLPVGDKDHAQIVTLQAKKRLP